MCQNHFVEYHGVYVGNLTGIELDGREEMFGDVGYVCMRVILTCSLLYYCS